MERDHRGDHDRYGCGNRPGLRDGAYGGVEVVGDRVDCGREHDEQRL
jgi:hypothetical protein